MTLRLRPEEELLISRSLDGDLSHDELSTFDRRCADDSAFREEVDARRRLKALLERTSLVEPDPMFAARVAEAVRAHEREEWGFLPFPRRYLPVASLVATAVVAVATFMLLQSRIPILRFWERQAETVRQAYEQTLSKGSLLPLLGDLDSDRALQFAFTGTLPLDEAKGTTLSVDDRSKDGYRIEVQKEAPRSVKGLTVSEFMSAVKPTRAQRQALDSVLNAGREELQTAVLVGANDEVAIKADLRRLNRAMVSGLAACLEPEQRSKMSRFMTVRDAPYVLVGNDSHARTSQEIVATLRPSVARSEFVVLRPDSLLITRYRFNEEELRAQVKQHQWIAVELAARRDRMMQRWGNETPRPTGPATAPEVLARVQIRTRRDRLSIEVSDSLNERVFFFNVGVAPRVWVEEMDPELDDLNLQLQVRTDGRTLAPSAPRPPASGGRISDSAHAKRRAFPVVVE